MPRTEIKGTQIKNSDINTVDIADGAITEAKMSIFNDPSDGAILGWNNSDSRLEWRTAITLGSDNLTLNKSGTADAGTQYPSYELRFISSVWDETLSQNEDRTAKIKLNAGSGANASEPYYLSIYDNGSNEQLRMDFLNKRLFIIDPNTPVSFPALSATTHFVIVGESGKNNGMVIISDDAKRGGLYFGDSGQEARGAWIYDHAVDALLLYTGGGERSRVTLAGRWGLANDNPEVGLHLGSTSSENSLTGTTDALISGSLEVRGSAYIADNIYHSGDPDTYIQLTANKFEFFTEGAKGYQLSGSTKTSIFYGPTTFTSNTFHGGRMYKYGDSTTFIDINDSGGIVFAYDSIDVLRVGRQTHATVVVGSVDHITEEDVFTVFSNDGNVDLESFNDGVQGSYYKIRRGRGAILSKATITDGDTLGGILIQGYTGSDFVNAGLIDFIVDGSPSTYVPTAISFKVSDGTNDIAEILRFNTDGILVQKTGTATVDTQYSSYELRYRASVWDTTNTQAEDREMYWTLNAGSGEEGSEPYSLSLYANDDTEMIQFDNVTNSEPTIWVPAYVMHLGDPNTGMYFREDRWTLYAGTRVMIDAHETTQNILNLASEAGQDIDVLIGDNNALFVEGSSQYIGIGTSSPGYNFDIQKTGDTGFRIYSTDSNQALTYLECS